MNAPDPRRRRLLQLAAGASLLPLAACKLSFEQGLFNECRAPEGQAVMHSPVVLAAWEGLRADRVWDVHAHLFGNGRSNAGIWVNRNFDHPTGPAAKLRRAMFVNGGCVGKDEAALDATAIQRVRRLIDQFPEGAKVMLLAFDFTYDETGTKREDWTTFSISHEYAERIAKSHPARFEWVASVHPYRKDAAEALEKAKAGGARSVKWLPPAMGIDLAHPKSLAFYDELKRQDLPLLVHLGEEQAVAGAERHEYGNPLHIRHALDRGVRVIAAHCASLGESPDLDANPNPAKARDVPNFELFTRLMAEKRYEGLLFGDISAVTQANRSEFIPAIVTRREWDGRLLNGTDYPLPGIMPLFSVSSYVSAGLIDEGTASVLKELRQVNPMMFDFVLKRSLRSKGERLPASVFETRPFFEVGHGRA
ncbi:hypothetical protein BWI17_19325 [Betaproteobacteria bacterium GR16-43]|nr:hypothetical protein BWI17_19325 [Betaproteobacteria bacterium GR16-43]